MGLIDAAKSFIDQPIGKEGAGKVGKAFVEEMEQQPGGLAGLVGTLLHNGLTSQVEHWSHLANLHPTTPGVVEQGIGKAIPAATAERSGIPAGVVTAGIAVLLPVVVYYLLFENYATIDGQPGAKQIPADGGLLKKILDKLAE